MFGKRIGFLKFKADVIDKETGKKVSSYMPLFYIVLFVHKVWFGIWIRLLLLLLLFSFWFIGAIVVDIFVVKLKHT